jgi:dihydropyrimidinase
MMHAENGTAIDVLVSQALARGDTAPRYHGLTRPWETEEEATHRAIMLAHLTGAPLYVVHMSAKQAVADLARARAEGWQVFGETCPQYLYLSLEEHLSAPGFEGAKYVCSTPLRSMAEGHQEELWRYLRTGALDVVSTDHCPFCMKEQKELGLGDFSKIPNGIGGVEHRMDLLYQGVVEGRISLPRWIELCCTTPARMFGLHPRKGEILPGADADLVVYDPAARTRISVDTAHMNMDYSAYEGFEIQGGVDTVVSRGTVVVEGDTYVGHKGHGQYLRRGLSSFVG